MSKDDLLQRESSEGRVFPLKAADNFHLERLKLCETRSYSSILGLAPLYAVGFSDDEIILKWGFLPLAIVNCPLVPHFGLSQSIELAVENV